jgi:hypothetical protein
MTAIAPPPVGNETEPSVQRDNARALEVLRGPIANEALASPRRAGGSRVLLGALLGLGLGAVTLLALFGANAFRAPFGFLGRGRRRLVLGLGHLRAATSSR